MYDLPEHQNTRTPEHQKWFNLNSFLLIVCITGFFFSCETIDLPESNNLQESSLSPDIKAVEGTLHFKDYKTLNNYQQGFSKMSEQEIVEMEKSLDFVSFRSAMNRSAEEFDDVITKEEFEKWKDRYKDILYMKGDEVTSRITVFSYELIANRNREYYVGGALHKLTEDKLIVIYDGDRSKLKRALTMEKSAPNENIAILNFPKEPFINTRDHEDCNTHYSRIEMEKDNHRKVYLDVYTDFVLEGGLPYYLVSRVGVKVHGRKKRLWGWHKYKTQLAYEDVSYQVRDHDGNLHSETNLSQSSGSSDKYDIDYWSPKYGIGFNSTIFSPPHPYLEKVKGKAISRGVLSLNRWAVLCCNYSNCPSATPLPNNPF